MPEEIRRHLLLPVPENGEPLPSPIPIRACLDMGITSYYTTPMSVIDLSTAVLPALESHSAPSDELSKESLDILLAEDNAINQKLAVKLLAVGDHRVDIADNGQIAFDKYKAAQERKKPYHVVLVSHLQVRSSLGLTIFLFDVDQMDVSMPVRHAFFCHESRSTDKLCLIDCWRIRSYGHDPQIGRGSRL